jgi:hypothetical protein
MYIWLSVGEFGRDRGASLRLPCLTNATAPPGPDKEVMSQAQIVLIR